MMKFLTETLSGNDGSPSTMRVLTSLIVLGVIGAWATVSIQKHELQTLSPEHVAIVLGALGLKAWQRGKEEPPIVPPTPK